MIELRGI